MRGRRNTSHRPRPWELPERAATPEQRFLDRRQLLATLGLGSLSLVLPRLAAQASTGGEGRQPIDPAVGERFAELFPAPRNQAFRLGDDRTATPETVAATHNNFYELSTDKERAWELGRHLAVDPWRVEVRGLVKKRRTLDLEAIFRRFPLEERLYRFRCVERWSMQVPWTGYPLRLLIDAIEPLANARWVRFVSLLDRGRLPGQRSQPWYPWPYYEALRLDEARHDLAFVAVGCYGHALPMQHGAPWRLAVPWKYGYKGPKSVVAIELTADPPRTFWNDLQPDEYGLYSNVDPDRPHPRWSQEIEWDIGTGERRPTRLYNGYAEQVAALYDGSEV